MAGYETSVLWVDLTTGDIGTRVFDEELSRQYLGGAGLAAKILWEETTADTDPLSPENPLVFMIGPVTGTMRSSSRYTVAGLSPLTGIWGEAHSGGDWGDELGHTPFKGIVVKGKAAKPVYLWLHNGEAELRDAGHLWGKDTFEVEGLLKRETDEKACVATIGPAGERLVRVACIMNDGKKGRAAASCGLGALMGSKNLKAIVVRGNQKIQMHDAARFKETVAGIPFSPIQKHEDMVETHIIRLGDIMNIGGPIKNWQLGEFEEGRKIFNALRHTKPLFCRTCPYDDMESKTSPDGQRHLCYEAAGPLGSNCLIDNVEALQEAYSICNRYGMNSISVGGIVGFAMECYEKGLITKEDTGGLELTWGNHEAMVEVVRQIAEREGIGELLGEGVKRAAERIGGLASEYAIHVKGLEFSAHDPRAGHSLAIAYATCNHGAFHHNAVGASRMENYIQVARADISLDALREFGYTKLLDRFAAKGKGQLVAKTQDWGSILNSLSVCSLVFTRRKVRPSHFVALVNCVTGWDMDFAEFMRVGERIFNLQRMINVRRGISRKDDTLPPRILTQKRKDSAPDESLPNPGLMLNEYYRYRGWSEEGIPTPQKLVELGLGELVGL
ncbi:aldehyde ferredoxin oxidoreductase family protein [Chloroflexota bacterium]